MRWINLTLIFFFLIIPCWGDSLIITTWNMHNFPSGKMNLKEKPEIEAKTISKAAQIFNDLKSDILILQEIRDSAVCLQLIDSIKSKHYHLDICSKFKDPSGIPTFQQIAIFSTISLIKSGYCKWSTFGVIDPPRGFAYCIYKNNNKTISVFGVHLKSNANQGGDNDKNHQTNILKRELAAEQIIYKIDKDSTFTLSKNGAMIIGGDFNTNQDSKSFLSEGTINTLEKADFINCFNKIKPEDRATCFSSGYPPTTFDFVFYKNTTMFKKPNIYKPEISDHSPITCMFSIK
jgi:endonuclease/exonuclease/phosphatase family metal-dependent hydrolase